MARYSLTPPTFDADTESDDEFVARTLRERIVPSDGWGYVKPSALQAAGWTVVAEFDPVMAPAGTVRYGAISSKPYVKGLDQKWYGSMRVLDSFEMRDCETTETP